MSVVKEFKEFAMKGSVVDLAVGIIIGGAFGKIVSSLVGDVIMPPLGMVIGGVDFRDLAVTLKAPLLGPRVLLRYGAFLQTISTFAIIGLRGIPSHQGDQRTEAKERFGAGGSAEPSAEELLLTEIRDLLRKQGRGVSANTGILRAPRGARGHISGTMMPALALSMVLSMIVRARRASGGNLLRGRGVRTD